MFRRIALALVMVAGCYDPQPRNGALHCDAQRRCPQGFRCIEDGTCWRAGLQPDLAEPIDLAASIDLGQPPVSTNQVDVLFVIDDSPGMRPKQAQLIAAFGGFAAALDSSAPASYHFGVVTSDLGAAQTTTISNCRPGGLGAKLQALGRSHAASCQPPVGGNFIEYDPISNTNNLPVGQSLSETFACMASVGDGGCGFEHTLEAAYLALHDCMPDEVGGYPDCSIPENRGFLRRDALLVVVFVTDEDDCSALPTSDLFDLSRTGTYGSLFSYRCTAFGIMCGSPPSLPSPYDDSRGPLSGCAGATPFAGARLFETDRYIQFFNGEAKSNPRSVLLALLAAPTTKVATFIGNPATYAPCALGAAVDGVNCAVLLEHSCVSQSNMALFGDPAVRLEQVVRSSVNRVQGSICDADYWTTLQQLADKISTTRSGG